jgi:hypothetical protein
MADWLQYDALASAQRGQPTLAAESCLAIVNVGRANRDLLGFMYLLVQNNNHLIVTVTLERVLAQGVVDEPTLTKLQKALETEAQENVFLAAARGERAFAHILLQHFKAGKRVEHKLHTNVGGLRGRLLDYFPDTVIRYYPERLHQMNRLVEIAKLPMHERIPELTKHTAELRAAANPLSDVRFINYHQEDLDRQCWLHSTIAAIACERYRLAHNNWPNDLNVVVKEKYLSPMPLDPVDGEPLRFTAKADGIVVYSVGRNGKDDGGAISRHGGVGDDQGFRLWDERFRGGPPVPIVEGKKKK